MTFQHWMASLPAEVIAARPRLFLYHGWARALSGDLDAAESDLQQIGKEKSERARAGVLRAYIGRLRGDSEAAIANARAALAELPRDDSIEWMSANGALALALLLHGELEEASRTARETLRAGRATGSHRLIWFSQIVKGQSRYLEGRLKAAEEICREAIQSSDHPELEDPI